MCIVVSFTSVVSMPVFNILLIALKNALIVIVCLLARLTVIIPIKLDL